MQQAEAKGRIIAIRVSDADFETLEGLKKGKGIGWNQLLLASVEAKHDLTLESAHPKGQPAKEKAQAEKPAETKKGGKGKKAKAEVPAPADEPQAPEVLEGEVIDPVETETGD